MGDVNANTLAESGTDDIVLINGTLNVTATSTLAYDISLGGGGMGLLKMLMPLVQAGGKFMKKGANKAGSGGCVKVGQAVRAGL